jgi:hypothetical protein
MQQPKGQPNARRSQYAAAFIAKTTKSRLVFEAIHGKVDDNWKPYLFMD